MLSLRQGGTLHRRLQPLLGLHREGPTADRHTTSATRRHNGWQHTIPAKGIGELPLSLAGLARLGRLTGVLGKLLLAPGTLNSCSRADCGRACTRWAYD